jgi:hypothetical protein
LIRAGLAAGAVILLLVPTVQAGESRILSVEHVGPDAGIMEVVPETVSYSPGDRSIALAGTLECPAEAGSQGVVVTVTQTRGSTVVQGESWDNDVQCGGDLSTTTIANGTTPFAPGPATIRIVAFVCDLGCGADVIEAQVVLLPSDPQGEAVRGHRR